MIPAEESLKRHREAGRTDITEYELRGMWHALYGGIPQNYYEKLAWNLTGEAYHMAVFGEKRDLDLGPEYERLKHLYETRKLMETANAIRYLYRELAKYRKKDRQGQR
ncbi:hypothetical protein KP626_07095 [Christensenella sp. MSJ-20]|uniref:hypothetical protein n=1 Tax=Christensenella sp. MSJ-20 TaxID=2841518 RepID=UPI001C7827C1|nr:hypothetical protein KP626_07095 [Christensenella sp. MSJ-20]